MALPQERDDGSMRDLFKDGFTAEDFDLSKKRIETIALLFNTGRISEDVFEKMVKEDISEQANQILKEALKDAKRVYYPNACGCWDDAKSIINTRTALLICEEPLEGK